MSDRKNKDSFQVIISEKAQKKLSKLAEKDIERIVAKSESLATDPFQAKKLAGDLAELYSLRVWPYRVIYIVNKKQRRVEIRNIGHRQGVYK